MRDSVDASIDEWCGLHKLIFLRVNQDRGQADGFSARKVCRVLIEVITGSGLCSEDSVAEFGDILIDLKDSCLVPDGFNDRRQDDFLSFSEVASVVGQKEVFDSLLSQGRSAGGALIREQVSFCGRFNGVPTKSVVVHEIRIFRGHDGPNQIRRNLIVVDPLIQNRMLAFFQQSFLFCTDVGTRRRINEVEEDDSADILKLE